MGSRRMGRPPGSTGDETRARILSASRACFGRYGYAETSQKMVADQIGLTAAALYRYFDSKLDLYVATLEDAFDLLVPRYRKAIAGAPTSRSALAAWAAASAAIHESDPSLAAFLSLLITEMRRHEPIARAVLDLQGRLIELVAEVVDAGRRKGEIASEVRAEDVVGMFLACSSGLSLWASYFGPEGGAATRVFGLLLSGRLFIDAGEDR